MSGKMTEHEAAAEYIADWGSKTPIHVIVACIKAIRMMFGQYKVVGIDKGTAWVEIEELFYAAE